MRVQLKLNRSNDDFHMISHISYVYAHLRTILFIHRPNIK
jgi:hypothetical protein